MNYQLEARNNQSDGSIKTDCSFKDTAHVIIEVEIIILLVRNCLLKDSITKYLGLLKTTFCRAAGIKRLIFLYYKKETLFDK